MMMQHVCELFYVVDEWMNVYLHSNQMNSHNKTYMQDNKATSAALTGAL